MKWSLSDAFCFHFPSVGSPQGQCDPMTRLFRQNLAIYNKLVFAQQQQFFTKSGLKFYQILKITTQKTYNFLPKCQNLLKSGHTVSTGSKIFPSNLIFPSLPFCPLKPVNLFMRKSSSQHESFLDSISRVNFRNFQNVCFSS